MLRRLSLALLLCWLLICSGSLAWAQTDYLALSKATKDPQTKIELLGFALMQKATNEIYYERALAYATLEHYPATVQDLLRALNTPGPYPKAAINAQLAHYLYLLNDFETAIQYANKALAEEPQNGLALYYRGWSRYRGNDWNNAAADFSQYINLSPETDDGYAARSSVYIKQAKYKDALTDIDKALGINPTNKLYIQNKIVILDQLGDMKSAESLLSNSLGYVLDDPLTLSKIGSMYLNHFNYEKALEYQTKAIALWNMCLTQRPGFAVDHMDDIYKIYLERGTVYYNLKDYANALADWSKAVDIKPDDFYIYNRIGELQTFQGNCKEAIKAYNKSFALNPTYPSGWVNLGFCNSTIGNQVEAVHVYTKALAIKDVESKGLLLNNRGFTYLELGQKDKCYVDLTQAIAVEPNVCMSHVSLGEYYLNVGDIGAAIAKFDFALSMPYRNTSETYTAYYNRGKCYMKQKNLDAAKADFSAALKVRPNSIEAIIALGNVLYIQKQYCEARSVLDKALVISAKTDEDADEAYVLMKKIDYHYKQPCP